MRIGGGMADGGGVAATRGAGGIDGDRGADGGLTAVPGVPITLPGSNAEPFGVSVDPTGRFLYVSVETSSRRSSGSTALAYTIDLVTGALTPVNTPSSVSASGTPQAMSITP